MCSSLNKSTSGFPGGSDHKASAYSARDPGSIPGLGRSPGEGNGNPFQYSRLENPMDRGVWWAIVHEVAKSWTWLSNFTSLHVLLCLSLKCFCHETSRIWASLSPKTRCVISVGRLRILAGFEPPHMSSSPNLRWMVSISLTFVLLVMLTSFGWSNDCCCCC